MLEKVKKKLVEVKKEREERARIERERVEAIARRKRERAKEEARRERERAEEEARKERERIQAEKDALMALNEKELMVEAIMVMRANSSRLNNMADQQDDLKNRINSLELCVKSLDYDISRIGSSVDELKYR